MNGSQVEEKLNKIARLIADDYRNGGVELEELVKKGSEDYLLSNPEIETLNAMVNHMVFKEKFAEDKLSTFKISKFDNILKVDRNMNLVEYKVASYGEEEIAKTAAEEMSDERDLNDVELTPQKAPLLMEAGEKNIDDIKDLYVQRDNEIDTIKNRVIALLQEGESLDNIYGVLKDTWGAENEEELQAFFDQLVEELKQEGYLKKEDGVDPEAGSLGADDSDPLKQAALSLIKIGSEIMVRESAHEMIMNKLAEEYPYFAIKLEERMPDEYYGVRRQIEKRAAAIKRVGNNIKQYIKNPTPNTAFDRALANVAVGSLLIAGAYGVADAASNATNAVRSRIWESKLKKKYPELNQIDDDRYRDIYRSLVGLEPSLLKAPYALKEMITAHDQYGTIDQNTVLSLLGSGRQNAPVKSIVGANAGRMLFQGESLAD